MANEEVIYEILHKALLTKSNLYTLQQINLFHSSSNFEIKLHINVQNISECIDRFDRAFECNSFNRTCGFCCDTISVSTTNDDQNQLVTYLRQNVWIFQNVDVSFFNLIHAFFYSLIFNDNNILTQVNIDIQIEYLPYNPFLEELINAEVVLFSWVSN